MKDHEECCKLLYLGAFSGPGSSMETLQRVLKEIPLLDTVEEQLMALCLVSWAHVFSVFLNLSLKD